MSRQDLARKHVFFGMMSTGSVGKSSLVERLVEGTFTEPKPKTTDAITLCTKALFYDGREINFVHPHEISAMYDNYYRAAVAYILVYSITSRQSFDEVQGFPKQILSGKDVDSFSAMVLVGTHCDLEADRQVSTKEAQEFADKLKIPFVETSAKTGVNCEEWFRIANELAAAEGQKFEEDEPVKLKSRRKARGNDRKSKCALM